MDVWRRIATYTDGTEVQEGDRIRYRQAPGGLLPASPDWCEGVAGKMREFVESPDRAREATSNGIDVEELMLICDDGSRRSIVGHIVERVQ